MFIRLVLIIFSLNLFSSGLSLEVIKISEKILPGMPLGEYITIKVKNESNKDLKFYYNPCTWVKLEVKGGVKYYEEDVPYVQRTPFSSTQEIKAGGYEICGFRDKVFMEEGNIKIKVIFDSNEIKKLAPVEYWKDLWIGRIESEEIDLEVRFENIIDREVFDKYGKNFKEFFDIFSKKEELLEKYPTSTYAGWALEKTGYYYVRWINLKNINIEGYLRPTITKADEKLGIRDSLKDYAPRRIKDLERYLQERPDFALASWFEFERAFWYSYIGDYERSYEICKNVIEKGDLDEVKKKARELINWIKERKLIKQGK